MLPPVPLEKRFDVGEVLEKAMEAFWTRGYEATSVQDLVQSTGINRGSLYATYSDKRALFLAALGRYDALRRALLADLEARHGPRDAIRKLFDAFASHASEKGGNRGCFLTNTALELAAHDAEVGRIVAAAQSGIEEFFARMIRKGKATGEIPTRVRTAATARGLLASLLGLLVLVRSRPERALLKNVVEDALGRLA
jgi:TetR/AcrR family transcriptional repressor of nem operon